jgi:hypothetical protein
MEFRAPTAWIMQPGAMFEKESQTALTRAPEGAPIG